MVSVLPLRKTTNHTAFAAKSYTDLCSTKCHVKSLPSMFVHMWRRVVCELCVIFAIVLTFWSCFVELWTLHGVCQPAGAGPQEGGETGFWLHPHGRWWVPVYVITHQSHFLSVISKPIDHSFCAIFVTPVLKTGCRISITMFVSWWKTYDGIIFQVKLVLGSRHSSAASFWTMTFIKTEKTHLWKVSQLWRLHCCHLVLCGETCLLVRHATVLIEIYVFYFKFRINA